MDSNVVVVLGAFYEGQPKLALWPGYNKPVIVKPTSKPNRRHWISCQILGPNHDFKLTIQKDRGCSVEQLGEPVSPATVARLMAVAGIVDPKFCS